MRNTGLRFLLPYMRPWSGALLLGTLYAIIGASASAFSPTLLGWAIDELNGGVRMQVLGIYALGLLALSGILALFRYLLRMLTGAIAAGVSYQMSQDMYARILTFDRRRCGSMARATCSRAEPATLFISGASIALASRCRYTRCCCC